MASFRMIFILVAILSGLGATCTAEPSSYTPAASDSPEDDRQQLEHELRDLNARLSLWSSGKLGDPATKADLRADLGVFAKSITWALHYHASFTPAEQLLVSKVLNHYQARLSALEADQPSWPQQKGRTVRGFISSVDGSMQPYGVIVPAKYDRTKPIRLDVVLHGSSQPTGLSELHFLSRFDDTGAPTPDWDYIELHPLARVENGYRWAGETDVFEAIEAVCRNYAVDRDRIVLRGMSMGASGTWHLGLKYPDRFVALGPYCGYVDTHQFSRTPLPNFERIDELPAHQEKMLHMIDAVDYAANAGTVPPIACMGEKDVFFQAHVLMGQAMAKEGLTLMNLISPGTGHVLDPSTHKEQLQRINKLAAPGVNRAPKHIRFISWTLKYSCCHWLQILGLEEHYRRAELEAQIANDGTIEIAKPRNVTQFAILPPMASARVLRVRVGGTPLSIPDPVGELASRKVVIGSRDGQWAYLGELNTLSLKGKRPGLQGPIDDAFTSSFLCIRGTGTPWNATVQTWSDANLKRFAYEWHRYFRGDLPVKDDTDVTAEDLRRYNLVLFGDPGSNRWIRDILPQLPIIWTRENCQIGQAKFSSANHAPVLIQPNPLAEGRYVVLNSGHTFHEKELSTLNYLLFPRVADWAVLKIGDNTAKSPSDPLAEEIIQTGFFDENWQIPQ
jgi:hypothetical protein